MENPPRLADEIVFLSYDRADGDRVDRLQTNLQESGLRVWRDIDEIFPGDLWMAKLREVLEHGRLAFLPCFSATSATKSGSVMSQEIEMVADRLRSHSRPAPRVFPIRLDPVDPPAISLGDAMLGDLSFTELYVHWEGRVDQLVRALKGHPAGGHEQGGEGKGGWVQSAHPELVDEIVCAEKSYRDQAATTPSVETLRRRAWALEPYFDAMTRMGWRPRLVVSRHPDPLPRPGGPIRRLMIGPSKRPLPAVAWDVELLGHPADGETVAIETLEHVARQGPRNHVLTADEVEKVFTPTRALLRSAGLLRGTVRFMVREGPGAPLSPAGRHHVLTHRDPYDSTSLDHNFGGDYAYNTHHHPESVEIAPVTRHSPLGRSRKERLKLLRPGLAGRDLA